MGASKKLGTHPREFAQSVANAADLSDIACRVEVAGPGFINIKLSDEFLSNTITKIQDIEPTTDAETVVIDYSSPNLAKEMHVGHLRSTVIGDSMARTLELLGHRVVRQNHVGDWGTPIGRLVAHIREEAPDQDRSDSPDLGNLQVLVQHYVRASEKFYDSDAFAAAAREAVVQLQGEDPQTIALWEVIREASLNNMREIYRRLETSISDADIRGESSYREELPNVVTDLDSKGLITESEGALCVFVEGFKRKDGRLLPMLVQKSDGGYLYHTTDLAAIRYRTGTLGASRILYFTDARQNQHFALLFEVARLAGYASPEIRLEHHAFGTVCDRSGRAFSNRLGHVIRLEELIDEAEARALKVIEEKSPHLPKDEMAEVVRAVAVGAIKYADLSKNLTQDYVFDWDSMLSLEGNTAPYLLYACARIQSVLAKAQVGIDERLAIPSVQHPSEHRVAVQLLRFQEVLEQVAEDARPHFLCSYLYELTSAFMRFYEQCPILDAPSAVRDGRLALCASTARVLTKGLACLGISSVTRM